MLKIFKPYKLSTIVAHGELIWNGTDPYTFVFPRKRRPPGSYQLYLSWYEGQSIKVENGIYNNINRVPSDPSKYFFRISGNKEIDNLVIFVIVEDSAIVVKNLPPKNYIYWDDDIQLFGSYTEKIYKCFGNASDNLVFFKAQSVSNWENIGAPRGALPSQYCYVADDEDPKNMWWNVYISTRPFSNCNISYAVLNKYVFGTPVNSNSRILL
jgi:hypothetical protein